MLGWEFPPFIAGGLGVACYGLTRALDRLGHSVIFVLPRPVDRSKACHVTLLSPDRPTAPSHRPSAAWAPGPGLTMPGFVHASMHHVPASFSSPYPGFADPRLAHASPEAFGLPSEAAPGDPPGLESFIPPSSPPAATPAPMHLGTGGGAGAGYSGDLVADAERYAALCTTIARRQDFDVIHAHDWLTYPAGLAASRASGKPLVVHVHSTEFDRSGDNVNRAVYDIERAGILGAHRVIAVSELTKGICVSRYGADPRKIDVVYNGIDRDEHQPAPGSQIAADDKIVLFLGRITMQKGPEYFIAAAKRVLEKLDKVKFVVAGSGDMALRMVELAASLGIGHKVFFTGFLRGRDVDRAFRMADCYVMPSVSEPFGLAALEAIHHDVPVILSKTAGAAEVLTHVLKVDFWDTDEMANKIVAVLRHPPLAQTLRQHGAFELRRLTWAGAAEKCVRSYRVALASTSAGKPVTVAR
jgi:glycosyltransferase involved in cell wall biosynthesis